MKKDVFKSIKKFLGSRSLKYGSNSIILIVAVIAIAIFVNIFVGMTSLKLDLTPDKLYSISDTTKQILKDLKQDVYIYGLFDEGKISSGDDLKEQMELLEKYKGPHVKIEYIDPDKNPGFIKSIDPDNLKEISKGDFVVKCGSKIKKISSYDLYDYTQTSDGSYQRQGSTAEQAFTGAIKYVTAEKTPCIYYTTGHDEKSLDSEYRTLLSVIQNNNYDTKPLNLVAESSVPDDASVVLVVSPKKDLAYDERIKLNDYLKEGGRAIFLFDSIETGTVFSRFEEVLSEYNISLNYDKVKENDTRRFIPNKPYVILPELQSSSATGNLGSGIVNMPMPTSRSINILKNQKEYLTTSSMLKTSDKAIGEQVDKSRGPDIAGPLDLAVSAEYTGGATPTKLVVVGNSYFVSDSGLNQYGANGLYFFMNSLLWMQDKKDDTVVAPKMYSTQYLNMDQLQANIVALCVVIVLPLLILGTGTFVWMRRRHL